MVEGEGCVICGRPGAALCSTRCRSLAERQREKNIARVHQLDDSDGSAEERYELSFRNGLLTAALMGWRPQVS